MKYLALLFPLFLSTWSNAQQRAQHQSIYESEANKRSDTLDVLHYVISLDLTQGASIIGSTEVLIQSKQNNVGAVSLDLLQLTVDSVVSTNQQQLSYQYNDTLLRIALSSVLNENDTQSITVYYHGNPVVDQTGWGGFYNNGNYTYNLGVGFGADPHNYGRVWHACFDNFVERATYSFHLETTSNKMAVSNGYLADSTILNNGNIVWNWELEESIPTYLAMFAAAPYAEFKRSYIGLNDTIPISVYAQSADTSNLQVSFMNLIDAISTFEEYYGPYAFNKVGYSLVPFNGGAMEHASNITYPRSSVDGTTEDETLMAHELAHHWWGNLATCETQEDMWLNEGWASYSEWLFLEKKYGWDIAVDDMTSTLLPIIRNAHLNEDGYRAISGLPHNLTYGTHTYNKGALVVWNLRTYLGDSLFFSGIQDFLQNHAFTSMNSAEFRDELSQSTGVDMDPFFEGWVFEGGYPAFELNEWEIENNSGVYTITGEIEQKLRGAPQYFNNVPVELKFTDGVNEAFHTVIVSGNSVEFNESLSFEPTYIELNPNHKLAYATTENTELITQPGNYDYSHALIQTFDVTQVNNGGDLKIEHFWVAPDPLKDPFTKPYRLSDYRYWKIDGTIDDFDASMQFFYDARAASGYLDSGLVSTTEDSLVLLYRADASDDWSEYLNYSKNMLGNSANGFGIIEVSNVLKGEYTLANIDHTVLSVQEAIKENNSMVSVIPNPSGGDLIIKANGIIDSVHIYHLNGKELKKGFSLAEKQIELSIKKSGVYIYRMKVDGQFYSGKFIVE